MNMKINLYSKLSSYMLYELFSFTEIKKKLSIIKYNKKFQKKMEISVDDYIAIFMFYHSEEYPNPNFIKQYQKFVKNYPEFPKNQIKNLFILSFEKQVEKMGYNYYNLSIFDDLFYDILHKRKITPYKITLDQNDLNQEICDELCKNKIVFLDIYQYNKVNNDYLKTIFKFNYDTIEKLKFNYLFEDFDILMPLKSLNEISFDLIFTQNQTLSFLSNSNICNFISKLRLTIQNDYLVIPDLCNLKELIIQSIKSQKINLQISNKTLQQLESLSIENVSIKTEKLEKKIELKLKKLSLIKVNIFDFNCPNLEVLEIENSSINNMNYNFFNNIKIISLKKCEINQNTSKFLSNWKRLEKVTFEFPSKLIYNILSDSFPNIKSLSLVFFISTIYNNLILEDISNNFENLEKLEIFSNIDNLDILLRNENYNTEKKKFLKLPLSLKFIYIENFQNYKINLDILEKIFDNLIEINITECPINLNSLSIFQNDKRYPKLQKLIIKNSSFVMKADKNALINLGQNLKNCKLIKELVIIDEGMIEFFIDIIISIIYNMEEIYSLMLCKKSLLYSCVQSDIYERYNILKKMKYLNKNNIYINY